VDAIGGIQRLCLSCGFCNPVFGEAIRLADPRRSRVESLVQTSDSGFYATMLPFLVKNPMIHKTDLKH
jgi:hypothetical protein